MNIRDLIAAATEHQGCTQHELSERLGCSPARISDWKHGRFKPETTTIVRLAEMAGLPVMETVAEIEAQLHPEVAEIWQRALGKLRAAGVAAAVLVSLTPALLTTPTDARAAGSADRMCIMSNNNRHKKRGLWALLSILYRQHLTLT